MLENYTDNKIREKIDSIMDVYEEGEEIYPCYSYRKNAVESLIGYVQELRDELKEVLQELPYGS